VRIAENVSSITLARGAPLYRAGDRCAGLYLVVSGRIMLSVEVPGGIRKVIELIGPAGDIGLAPTVLGAPHTVSADAVADTQLLLIPAAALLDGAAQSGELALQLMSALSRRVHELVADIKAFSLHSGRERVVDYLLQFAANGGRARPFTLPAKKSVIASRLNLTPEYFSRILHELISTRAITVNGRQITVLDAARMRVLD
jgi:CRP-like cAMP-binding protein